MNCNSCPVSDPILSSQVTDVDLRMPKCMDTCDNSLNGWLKWLAEKQCECDWESVSLEGIQPLLEQESCDINLCTIVNSLLEATTNLYTEMQDCCEEVIYPIPEDDWTPTRPLRAFKKGNRITLTGAAQATVSYTADIATLPSNIVPSTNLYIPIAHDFAPSAAYNVFLRILPTGVLKLYITGTAPSYGTARTIYLDGVTFFLN